MSEATERVFVAPEGNEVKILHGDVKIHNWNTKSYRIKSMQAMIDVIKGKGSKEKSVVFYDETAV
jgi:hypothetical protein